MRWIALPLLLLVLVVPATADEGEADKPKPRPEERAGREVLRSLAAGDEAAVAKLAVGTDPDPWMIADWLLTQGEADAAEAFARVAEKHKATRKLPKYVAARRGTKGDAASREALAQAVRAIEARRYAEAYPLLEKLDAKEATVLHVQVHFAKGMSLYVQGRRAEALRALAAGRERAHRIGWLTLESQILQWMAQTATEQGNALLAVAHARARLVVEDGLSGRHKQHAHAVTRLVNALQAAGAYDDALAAAAHGIDVQRKADDALGLAQLLVLSGAVATRVADFEKGLEDLREGLELYEAADDAPGIADALIAVGSVYEDMDEYARAKTFLKRAVSHAKKTGQAHYHARARMHLGSVHRRLGEYPQALKCYEQSLAYDRSTKNARLIAVDLNNLAVLYEELGSPAKSRALLRETLEMFEALNDQPSIAMVCLNLGVLARLAGDWAESAKFLDRAAQIRRRANKPRDVAGIVSALGALASDKGNYAEAVGLHREALRLYGAAHDRGNLALTLSNLGLGLHRMGDSEEALPLLEKSVEEAAAIRGRRLEVMVRGTLALVHLEVGNPKAAMLVAEQGLKVMEHLLGGLAEEEGARTRASHAGLFQIGALAALQAQSPAKVLKFLEAGRAGSLLESLGGRDALRYADDDLPEELRNAEAKARLAEAKAASRYRRLPASATLSEHKAAAKTLGAATERVREVVVRIQRESKSRSDLVYPRPASLSEIQRHLAKDQALVVYGFCHQKAVAVVLESKSVRALELGPSIKLYRAVADLGRPEVGVDAMQHLAALRGALVKPLGLKKSVRRVLVSPSGPLCYVPFGALFEQPVAMTPSGTTHSLLHAERRKPGRGVLALGDPAYPSATSAAGQVFQRGGARLVRLPATREEAEKVGDTVLLGEAATESGFRAGVAKQRRWRAVHLACHGRVDRERPNLCALALTPGEEDDGFLTLHEVLRMQVPADLAVLSACETGKGQVVHGEGIVGLTRAFMYAGSPRVLCSLWKVDDEATQALMVKFYALWNPRAQPGDPERGPQGRVDGAGPMGAAEALQQAQAFVRRQKKWEHPYYWAAWVLWGLPD